MQYVNLGRSGLKVSRLCLGTMNFGPSTDEATSFAIMDEALTQGIQFFDTANTYGGKATEEIIGRWFKQSGQRDAVVLATKFQGSTGPGPNDRGASAYNIRQACDASLRRLQTDHIDLYQMHHCNRDVPWDEYWQAMDVLIQQGKIIYTGSSNFAGWQIASANEAARQKNLLGLVSEQHRFSLLCRWAQLEVLPAARAYGVGVITYSPLASGILGGPATETAGRRGGNPKHEATRTRLQTQLGPWEELCAQLGHAPANVALAWQLNFPMITAPIIGPRTVAQVKDVLDAVTIKLDAPTLARLDEIFPPVADPEIQKWMKGPYRLESPEAYAW
ncbi:MAG: aldo/keto reductase [Phycisphaerae bacterium]